MSYELIFWRYQVGAHPDHPAVYESLCDDEEVDGLDDLPVDLMLDRVAESFADWDKLDGWNYEREVRGSFQLSTTGQSLRVDCYGMEGEDMNRFIDIAAEFGCPLYDPQVEVRYDGGS